MYGIYMVPLVWGFLVVDWVLIIQKRCNNLKQTAYTTYYSKMDTHTILSKVPDRSPHYITTNTSYEKDNMTISQKYIGNSQPLIQYMALLQPTNQVKSAKQVQVVLDLNLSLSLDQW